jgi:hypothetical protein
MTGHLIECDSSGVDPLRYDGWIVTYAVEIIFDTDATRTHYDHVGTVARCTCCGRRLNRFGSTVELVNHARAHEEALSADPSGGAVSHTFAVGAIDTQAPSHREEVDSILTRGVD